MKLSDAINNKDWKITGKKNGKNIWIFRKKVSNPSLKLNYYYYQYVEDICEYCGKICLINTYKNSNKNFCDTKCAAMYNSKSRIIKKIEVKCPTCGKIFYELESAIKSGRGKYCSDKCKYKAKEKPDISKKCLNCGKLFYGKPGIIKDKKFCNRTCFNEFKKKNAFREIKICPVCGKEFIVKQRYNVKKNGGKYCSPLCQNIARRKEKIKKICLFCGEEFLAWPCEADKRKYCSLKCRSQDRIKSGWYSSQENIKKGLTGFVPNYNKNSCKYFDKINQKYGLIANYATTFGEFKIPKLGYWLDFMAVTINLAIEWDEKSHYDRNGNLKEKDVKRQREIESVIGKNLIRIREWVDADKAIAEGFIRQRVFKLRG